MGPCIRHFQIRWWSQFSLYSYLNQLWHEWQALRSLHGSKGLPILWSLVPSRKVPIWVLPRWQLYSFRICYNLQQILCRFLHLLGKVKWKLIWNLWRISYGISWELWRSCHWWLRRNCLCILKNLWEIFIWLIFNNKLIYKIT